VSHFYKPHYMTLFGIYCYLILVQIANRIGPGRPSCCRRVPSACYAVRCPREAARRQRTRGALVHSTRGNKPKTTASQARRKSRCVQHHRARARPAPFFINMYYKPTPAAVRDKTQKTHKKVPNLLLSHFLHDYQYCCLQV